MDRRALLTNATRVTGLGAAVTAGATATAGCVGTISGGPAVTPEDVRHLEDPAAFERNGVPFDLDADATREDAWVIGETPDGDPQPIDVAVANAAGEAQDCSFVLSVDGTERVNARVELPAGGYSVIGLRTPARYAIDVGHRPDLETVTVDRDAYDCNAKTVTAQIAADGSVDVSRITQTLGCG
jgi:hypothetical protein